MTIDDEQSAARARVYQRIHDSPEFAKLLRRRRRFIVPISAAFLAWYAGYVVVAAYAPGFMAFKVTGNITVGMIMGILQVLSAFLVTTWYVRHMNQKIDPLAAHVRGLLDLTRGQDQGAPPAAPSVTRSPSRRAL